MVYITSLLRIHAGLLSKSKGQTLRIAAVMHVLLHWETPATIPTTISQAALKAAQSFVEVCVQHACFCAGRKELKEEIDTIVDEGIYYSVYRIAGNFHWV